MHNSRSLPINSLTILHLTLTILPYNFCSVKTAVLFWEKFWAVHQSNITQNPCINITSIVNFQQVKPLTLSKNLEVFNYLSVECFDVGERDKSWLGLFSTERYHMNLGRNFSSRVNYSHWLTCLRIAMIERN
jgi:hypothetical protein